MAWMILGLLIGTMTAVSGLVSGEVTVLTWMTLDLLQGGTTVLSGAV